MTSDNYLKNQKVLVMGLGLLRGGASATKWLIRHGAKVTVTDLKSRRELAPSIKSLGLLVKKAKFILGRHRENDFKTNDIIVVNPAVPRISKYLKIAKCHGLIFHNEASLFFMFCRNPVIGITGTRGKTTTANWAHHLLKKRFKSSVLSGNSSDKPMLEVLDRLDGRSPVVVELSSWHLEFLPESHRAPHIAVITNIYRDHMNRYRGMRDYAGAKANIFKYQTSKDFLILNKKSSWTEFFLNRKPRAKVVYFSRPIGINRKKFEEKFGAHNLENFTASALAAGLAGLSRGVIRKAAFNLPQVKFRQETIFNNRNLKIINDTTATSPDGTIAALRRFGEEKNLILIAGGTDKKLDFSPPAGGWARTVKTYVKVENLYLLNGSATKKMVLALKKIGYFKKFAPQLFENLPSILLKIKSELKTKNDKLATILFSPGAASFEKFKNEFDRGEKFNKFLRILTH